MFKTNALNSVGNAYVDKDTGSGTPGTRLEADDRNIIQDELTNAVTGSGQTLNSPGIFTDNSQLELALAIYGAGGSSYMIDTGIADTYLLDAVGTKTAPPFYFDGMTVQFVAGSDNTGDSTVDIASLGAKNIRRKDGTILTAGEISGNTTIRYNASGNRFDIISSIFQIDEITSSGNYTILANDIFVICWGGGGGGATSIAGVTAGAGGGGGGCSIKRISGERGTVAAIAVGTGGGGGTSPSAGGNTTFSTFASAEGGEAATRTAAVSIPGNGGYGTGVAGFLFIFQGGIGTSPFDDAAMGDLRVGGAGGAAALGSSGVRQFVGSTIATPGVSPGGGGAGGNLDVAEYTAGSDGASGKVLVLYKF